MRSDFCSASGKPFYVVVTMIWIPIQCFPGQQAERKWEAALLNWHPIAAAEAGKAPHSVLEDPSLHVLLAIAEDAQVPVTLTLAPNPHPTPSAAQKEQKSRGSQTSAEGGVSVDPEAAEGSVAAESILPEVGSCVSDVTDMLFTSATFAALPPNRPGTASLTSEAGDDETTTKTSAARSPSPTPEPPAFQRIAPALSALLEEEGGEPYLSAALPPLEIADLPSSSEAAAVLLPPPGEGVMAFQVRSVKKGGSEKSPGEETVGEMESPQEGGVFPTHPLGDTSEAEPQEDPPQAEEIPQPGAKDPPTESPAVEAPKTTQHQEAARENLMVDFEDSEVEWGTAAGGKEQAEETAPPLPTKEPDVGQPSLEKSSDQPSGNAVTSADTSPGKGMQPTAETAPTGKEEKISAVLGGGVADPGEGGCKNGGGVEAPLEGGHEALGDPNNGKGMPVTALESTGKSPPTSPGAVSQAHPSTFPSHNNRPFFCMSMSMSCSAMEGGDSCQFFPTFGRDVSQKTLNF